MPAHEPCTPSPPTWLYFGDPTLKTVPPTSWYRQIAVVLTRHILLKAIGTPLCIGLFFGAYFYVLKNPAYPVTVMPVTWLDQIISFQPWAMSLYVSLWVYVSLPPALLATRRELAQYALALGGTCLAGLMVFYFWPTAVPAPDIDWALHPEMEFLKSLDGSGNAFPSLHVATVFFSAIWLNHLLRRFDAPQGLLLFSWLWCIGIVYSTLATHQHVALDMWSGLALGGMAAWLSLRQRAVAAPAYS